MCDNEMLMKSCSKIAKGTSPVAGKALEHLLSHVEGWEVEDGWLTKSFRFVDHFQVMAFVNAIAWISHREDHHPELVVTHDTCTVSYLTHLIEGLSENDFICAAKVDHTLGD